MTRVAGCTFYSRIICWLSSISVGKRRVASGVPRGPTVGMDLDTVPAVGPYCRDTGPCSRDTEPYCRDTGLYSGPARQRGTDRQADNGHLWRGLYVLSSLKLGTLCSL